MLPISFRFSFKSFFLDRYLYSLSLFPKLGHQLFIALLGKQNRKPLAFSQWLLFIFIYYLQILCQNSWLKLARDFLSVYLLHISKSFKLFKAFELPKKISSNFRYCWDDLKLNRCWQSSSLIVRLTKGVTMPVH